MTVSKKFEKIENQLSDLDIEKLIEKGGSAPKKEKESADLTRITLTISNDFLENIDSHRKDNAGFISRNTWILQAIKERLSKIKEEEKTT